MQPALSQAADWAQQFEQALGAAQPLDNLSFMEPVPVTSWQGFFSDNYRQDFIASQAVADLHLLDQLNQQLNHRAALRDGAGSDNLSSTATPVASQLTPQEGSTSSASAWQFRILHANSPIALSDILPLLENFGFRVIGENAYRLSTPIALNIESTTPALYHLHVFQLELQKGAETAVNNGEQLCSLFESAFEQVWNKRIDSDAFNSLLFRAGIGWRHIEMLRAYANYIKQIGLPYTRPAVAAVLGKNAAITQDLVSFFNLRFDPNNSLDLAAREAEQQSLKQKIKDSLDEVEVLNDDLVLRQCLALMEATLRTSFFRQQQQNFGEHCLAFKFDASSIQNLPKPKPKYEIFVYDARVQGVHLRGGKVSRGGLRWSDRFEDFRTEVLGLVKAQQVKNAVIVPMGAKGGFVCQRKPASESREDFIANGVFCYKLFINSLLAVTDNLVDGEVVKPEQTVCWDDDDPYLVVAADKGTATFSDIANEISSQRQFWLGDAFASGGSVGYDHKAMGITARGAWVAVQRHFRELGIDVQEQPFTAVAIGDMAGDVFGNGMLCSRQTRLIAAFNHAHIFLDPDPNPETSYAERQRLFDAVQGWGAYNTELISSGGGIFSRSAKSIPLSPEVRNWLHTNASEMTPDQLIHAILQAEVDLLWNGGIGTYIKSSAESHAAVGDRANNELRVNGNELGARVFGEGGNLGATQLGRVEFCLHGGRCNSDFIDNAGGVDCSDHEVNIKILLGDLVASGSITSAERNATLFEMTGEVADMVLHNNYRQTQAISMVEREARSRGLEYQRLIADLERRGLLDRAVEFIPDDETLAERKSLGQALTRPEISVLVSYAKLTIKSALLDSDVFSDPRVAAAAERAFPERLRQAYPEVIQGHRLHREIVATQVAGNIINRMGISFVQRMQEATGESVEAIAKAYLATVEIFDVESRWQAIEQLDGVISADLQYRMFSEIVRLLRRSTRWLLRRCRSRLTTEQCVEQHEAAASYLNEGLPELMCNGQLQAYSADLEQYREAGVPADLAAFVAGSRHLYNTFAIQRIVEESGFSVADVCRSYFSLGESLQLNWFSDQIVSMSVDNYWQALARESFRDDLESQQAALARNWMQSLARGDVEYDEWLSQYQSYVDRWQAMVGELLAAQELDVAMYPVALRELLDLVQASEVKAVA